MSIRKAALSHRVAALAPMSLAGLAATAHEIGAIDIASGVPVHDPPNTVLTAAATAMRTGRNQYVPAAGTPALRRAVARHLWRSRGVEVDPDHEITITSGATEGTLVALLAAVDPGDEVILPEPYFESYPGTVRLLGAAPRPVRLSGAAWRLDPDAIRAAITPRTRAILLNTPHNPTGRVFTADEMLALVEICVRHGIICITDEVYDNFVFDAACMTSPLNLVGVRDHSIVVGSFSKSLQMSGWRLGYCVASAELTSGLRRVVERTTVCASTPLQEGTAAATGFSSGAQDFQARRDHMVKRLGQAGLDTFTPEGGWFVFAGITGVTESSSQELAEQLLTRAGVLVAPGTPFFSDPEEGGRWIRTTFVRDPSATDEGLDRLERFLREAA